MSRFEIHWSEVSPNEAPGIAAPGCTVLALWPAPVNPDTCFEEAGFQDFGDNDNDWDIKAHELLCRIVSELTKYGNPRVVSQKVQKQRTWWRRFLYKPREQTVLQQIELPTQWDSLPRCLVAFGDNGATLRTGNGHVLFWITLPPQESCHLQAFVRAVSANHPVTRTPLRWKTLLIAP